MDEYKRYAQHKKQHFYPCRSFFHTLQLLQHRADHGVLIFPRQVGRKRNAKVAAGIVRGVRKLLRGIRRESIQHMQRRGIVDQVGMLRRGLRPECSAAAVSSFASMQYWA